MGCLLWFHSLISILYFPLPFHVVSHDDMPWYKEVLLYFLDIIYFSWYGMPQILLLIHSNIFINIYHPPPEVSSFTQSIHYSIFASNKEPLLCFTTIMLEYLISSRGAIQFVWSGTPEWGQIREEETSTQNLEGRKINSRDFAVRVELWNRYCQLVQTFVWTSWQ